MISLINEPAGGVLTAPPPAIKISYCDWAGGTESQMFDANGDLTDEALEFLAEIDRVGGFV